MTFLRRPIVMPQGCVPPGGVHWVGISGTARTALGHVCSDVRLTHSYTANVGLDKLTIKKWAGAGYRLASESGTTPTRYGFRLIIMAA